jgi:hypothetical protein
MAPKRSRRQAAKKQPSPQLQDQQLQDKDDFDVDLMEAADIAAPNRPRPAARDRVLVRPRQDAPEPFDDDDQWVRVGDVQQYMDAQFADLRELVEAVQADNTRARVLGQQFDLKNPICQGAVATLKALRSHDSCLHSASPLVAAIDGFITIAASLDGIRSLEASDLETAWRNSLDGSLSTSQVVKLIHDEAATRPVGDQCYTCKGFGHFSNICANHFVKRGRAQPQGRFPAQRARTGAGRRDAWTDYGGDYDRGGDRDRGRDYDRGGDYDRGRESRRRYKERTPYRSRSPPPLRSRGGGRSR